MAKDNNIYIFATSNNNIKEMSENKLIKITNKDWHYRLVKFCWGIEPKVFKNLCPYFWLTIASIFVCVPIGLFKFIGWLGMTIIHYSTEFFIKFNDALDAQFYSNKVNHLSNGQIYYFLNFYDRNKVWEGDNFTYYTKLHTKYDKTIDDIIKDIEKIGITKKTLPKSYADDYKREIAALKKEQANREAQLKKMLEDRKRNEAETYEKLKKRQKKMEDFAKKVSLFTKNAFMCLLAVLTGFIGFLLSNVLTWAFVPLVITLGEVEWIPFLMTVLRYTGCIIAAFLVGYLTYCMAVKMIKMYDNLETLDKNERILFYSVYYPAKWIFNVLKFVGIYCFYYPIWVFLIQTFIIGIIGGFIEGFNEFGGIFKDYFDASYSDYCPGIEWGSDDEENA